MTPQILQKILDDMVAEKVEHLHFSLQRYGSYADTYIYCSSQDKEITYKYEPRCVLSVDSNGKELSASPESLTKEVKLRTMIKLET